MGIKLYDEKGQPFIYGAKVPLSHGSCGIVYKIDDDKCFKIFWSKSASESIDVMKDIRELQLDNFF